MSYRWTDERVAELRRLWPFGYRAGQIATMLGDGLTKNAVIGKRRRIGLPDRPCDTHQPRIPRSPPRAVSKPLPTAAIIELPPKRIPLLSAGYGECRYPLWNDDDPLFHVCGLPSGAESYCEHHARLCWTGKVKNAARKRAA